MIYGLAKIHNALEDWISLFWTVLSAIGKSPDNLAKLCDQLLKPLTSNEYIIKDSFSFAKVVLEFDDSLFVASFDRNINRNVKPLHKKYLQKSNLCQQPELKFILQFA